MPLSRKNITTYIVFLSAIVIIAIALISPKIIMRKQTKVCFRDSCFTVEVATKPEEQIRGLMFKERLDSDRGMLFIFDTEAKYPFWMKNTLILLDIIWIDKDRRVVFISKNSQPCAESFCSPITPGEKAKYVLEINGGMAEKIGLSVGDKINFDSKLFTGE